MPKPNFDNYQKNDRLSRRRMLSLLSVAGVATASTTVGAETLNHPRFAKKLTTHVYISVAELKQDDSLEEGDFVATYGYHSPDDGGHATYQVIRHADQQVEEGQYIQLHAGLLAKLVNVDQVNYKIFGAKSDGESDDGVQIKLAHEYANAFDIPVENTRGEFWIKRANNIAIQTNVCWGNTRFHIDERYNTGTPRFVVTGRQGSKALTLSAEDKESVLRGLKNKDLNIPALAPYSNSLAVIVDSKDKYGARYSGSLTARVRNKQDFFVIEEYGRILGDVVDFNDYTTLTIYPGEQSYLVIEGGTFLLSGHSSELMEKGYMHSGIQVTRSRSIIKNQWVGLEPGQRDAAMLARHGFYSFWRTFDVHLKNIRQIPYEKTRGTRETTVPQGTYGISCNTVMNAVFSNITAEADRIHWGVFGTNHVKNVWIDRCVFNRFDVHSFGWNIYIKDSDIGQKGITVTGGGELRVENSTCRGMAFISFRNDYGSRWDGEISVKNCTYYPGDTANPSFLRYGNRNLDFRYVIGYGRRITLENVQIDYEGRTGSDSPFWLLNFAAIKSYEHSGKLFFPEEIVLKNISLKGRTRGLRIMQIPSPDSYILPTDFFYDGSFLAPNARITMENIQQLETSDAEGSPHFSFEKSQVTLHSNSLVPQIRIKDCSDIRVAIGGNRSELLFENTTVQHLDLGTDSPFEGGVQFSNCKFRPDRSTPNGLKLDTVLGTTMINCHLFLPPVGKTGTGSLAYYGFMEINGKLRFNHQGTRLGNDILVYLKGKGIMLKPEFIAKLKAHHELED